MRSFTHAGERRRYRIAVGEAGDAVVILAVGERQLVAGCIANENHLAFRVAHILEYIAARIIRGNRVSAVCGHDNILCNLDGFVKLSRNRGREVRAAVVPPDRGGYAVLDIVFGDKMEADLVVTPFEMKDDASGRTITGNTYKVRSVDENGEVYECKIKPFRASDKTLITMLLN